MAKTKGKVREYVKNTAWIQPILIVVIIFAILFSLNPLTNLIKRGWAKLTMVNNMETITYKEYVEKVSGATNENFIIVFTNNNDEDTSIFFKSMNTYMKSVDFEDNDFKIYNVNLTTKSSKVTINGTKYGQYKDKTCGLVSSGSETKEDIVNKDYINLLDQRIGDFARSFGGEYADLVTGQNFYYDYVSTPLVIWYQNGIETRINNAFTSCISLASSGKNATASSFRTFIEDFEGEVKADNWDDTFDLVAFTGNSIKD